MCVVIRRKSVYHLHSSRWHFQTRYRRLNCRWAHSKRRWTCTTYKNLVSFYPVLLQLMSLKYVLQAPISNRVNSFTFTRGQHVVFRYYSLGCDTAMPGVLYAGWALPRISSKFFSNSVHTEEKETNKRT